MRFRNGSASSDPPFVSNSEAFEDSGLSAIDVRRYLKVLDERKWTIMIFFVLVVVAVTAWTLRQTPVYKASATVQVDLQAPSVLGREVEQVESLETGSYWNNQEYMETQYKVVQSREVAHRVVEALNLDEDPDFVGQPDKRLTETEIAEKLRKRVLAEPVRDSRLFKISVEDTNPERARDIANAMADAYLEQNVERMLSATISAVDWLSRQSDSLQRELESSERALYEFRRDRDILSVSLEDRQNIIANQIQKLSDVSTSAKARRIELGAIVAEIRNLAKTDPLEMPVSQLVDNSLIQQLKNQYTDLSKERAGLAERYGGAWPRVREIDEEIAGIREAIGREVRSVLASVEGEYRAAVRTEAGLRKALTEVQQEALELNMHELEFNQLDRRQKNNAKMYELVLGRTKETDLARLLRVNNLRILDYAITPTSSIKPRVMVNIAIAVILGLFGGIGLAFVLEFMDFTVRTQVDLEALGVAFLGIVPSIEPSIERRKRRKKHKGNGVTTVMRRDLFVHEHPKSSVAESCRSIRTNLLFISPEEELQSFVITSPGPQEGKTTVATSLAIVMAQSGSRVLLVDTDMRRPRVHHAFGIESAIGISSVIVGQVSLADAIQPTEITNFFVLPCGPVPPNPAELLHTARFREILEDLKRSFDRVIFDTPPMGAVTDAAILSTIADGVVLVGKVGTTRKEGARQAVFQLRELGSPILGTVLNDVDLARRDYGYYYYYRRRGRGHYYYGYGEDREAESVVHSDSSVEEARLE